MEPQVLVAQHLANSETTVYTVVASTSVILAGATLTNTSASAVTVSVSVVKTGGSAASSNRVLSGLSIAAGDSVLLHELSLHVLGPGDKISAIASTASTVAFVLSGYVTS
jgi:hypothetical protein